MGAAVALNNKGKHMIRVTLTVNIDNDNLEGLSRLELKQELQTRFNIAGMEVDVIGYVATAREIEGTVAENGMVLCNECVAVVSEKYPSQTLRHVEMVVTEDDECDRCGGDL